MEDGEHDIYKAAHHEAQKNKSVRGERQGKECVTKASLRPEVRQKKAKHKTKQKPLSNYHRGRPRAERETECYPCRFATATVRSLPASRLSNSPLALVSFLSWIM
jgi:hypothetical protein